MVCWDYKKELCMKNISKWILISLLLIGTYSVANAIQSPNIEEQKSINKNAVEQAQSKPVITPNMFEEQFNALGARYMNNFRQCEPLHVSQYLDIFGLKIGFKLDINGWVDNKCSYEIKGRIDGIGKDIREVFNINIEDEAISKIEPIIKCDFTKDQLNILIDGMIARNETKEQLKDMLQEPSEKYIAQKTKVSEAEEKMHKMIVESNACTIPNMNELMQNFSNLMPSKK